MSFLLTLKSHTSVTAVRLPFTATVRSWLVPFSAPPGVHPVLGAHHTPARPRCWLLASSPTPFSLPALHRQAQLMVGPLSEEAFFFFFLRRSIRTHLQLSLFFLLKRTKQCKRRNNRPDAGVSRFLGMSSELKLGLHSLAEESIVCFTRVTRDTVKETKPEGGQKRPQERRPPRYSHCYSAKHRSALRWAPCRAEAKCYSNIPLQ